MVLKNRAAEYLQLIKPAIFCFKEDILTMAKMKQSTG
jgi:hypothetical protein